MEVLRKLKDFLLQVFDHARLKCRAQSQAKDRQQFNRLYSSMRLSSVHVLDEVWSVEFCKVEPMM